MPKYVIERDIPGVWETHNAPGPLRRRPPGAAMAISSGLLWSNLKRDEGSSFEATVCGVCFAVSLMGLALLAPVFLFTT